MVASLHGFCQTNPICDIRLSCCTAKSSQVLQIWTSLNSLRAAQQKLVLVSSHDAFLAGPIVSPLNVSAAVENKDSLAKMVYSRMFDWLVEKINTAIGQDPDAMALVGVLDIYGELTFNTVRMHFHFMRCNHSF